jgi:hypothetical protein
MSVVTKQLYNPPSSEPVMFIDSVNMNTYLVEMYSICNRHIRNNDKTINDNNPLKKETLIVKDEESIKTKEDGFWIIADEKNYVITLYKKTTISGYLYNYPTIEKVFTLTCKTCPRVVPQLFEKTNNDYSFIKELNNKIQDYAERNRIFYK